MSFALTLSELSGNEMRSILKEFTVRPKKTQYVPDPPKYRCFTSDRKADKIYLPLGKWREYVDLEPGETSPNGEDEDFPTMSSKCVFTKTLLTKATDPAGRGRDQDVVCAKALRLLRKNGAAFVASYTGFGKTASAIYLATKLRLKTIIVCHFDIVRKQWPGEFEKFTDGGAKCQFLKGSGCKLDPTADVYIAGIRKVANMKPEDFIDIGTVIIDEAHVATVTAFTDSLLKFTPRYLIGLSATPDRPDGMHSLLSNFFGPETDFIVRREKKDFTVIKHLTPFRPTIEYTIVRGKSVPDWNKIVNSIEENPKRHQLVADVVKKYPNEKIIVLCNRNVLTKGVYDLLLKSGESVDILMGTKKGWDASKRVLVAGFKKGGVGLNDPKLTMAIIASDTKDVRQYEGRIRTSNNIIYHFVDDYQSFENHWGECMSWYLEKGARIEHAGEVRTTSNYGARAGAEVSTTPRRRMLKKA